MHCNLCAIKYSAVICLNTSRSDGGVFGDGCTGDDGVCVVVNTVCKSCSRRPDSRRANQSSEDSNNLIIITLYLYTIQLRDCCHVHGCVQTI